jgi:hypothetical protein
MISTAHLPSRAIASRSGRTTAAPRALATAFALMAFAVLAAPRNALAQGANDVSDPRNFEGMWTDLPTNNPFVLGIDLPYKPAAQNLAADRIQWFREGNAYASAHLTCRPTGVQGITSPKGPVLILQTAEKLVMISQEDREVRNIFFSAEHPRDLQPTYSGHAVAQWQGNTLVVDVTGYNGKGQLDEVGNPHSDQLHLVQKITKSADGNTLNTELTFTDPVYYTKSFTKTRAWRRIPGTKMLDYDCSENPRADLYAMLTFTDTNQSFRPTCIRAVDKGIAAEKVVCAAPSSTPRPKKP